jgi:hypothetical protein
MMSSQGIAKVARIRRLSQHMINRELRFKAEKARLPPAGRSAHGFPPGRTRLGHLGKLLVGAQRVDRDRVLPGKLLAGRPLADEHGEIVRRENLFVVHSRAAAAFALR